MASLLDFCSTEQQKQIIKLYLAGLSSVEIAVKLGHPKNYSGTVRKAICRVKKAAEDRGFDPEHHRNHVVPSNQIVTGYSDLVRYPENDPLGRILGWIKTNRKLAEQINEAHAMIDAMALSVPKVEPAVYRGNIKEPHHFSVIPLGDPHIGLRTWSKEVGTDWDVPTAMRVFEKVFRRLLERTPDTEVGVLFNSGDFFHADNIAGETARSGHKLDLDGRPGFWLDAGFSLIRLLIDMALQKYSRVVFINTPGNHDDILGLALGSFVAQLYINEPRLTCQRGTNPFQYYSQGQVALGFCHGHTCKLPSLPGKMADDQAEMWGRTRLRHWFTGHVHHNSWLQWKEHPGCTVETVGIIPPKDAYAHGGAYGNSRGTQLVIFDERGYTTDRFTEFVLPTD